MSTKLLKNLPRAKVDFNARAVQCLPEGKDWLYEIKFDGYRALAGKSSSGVTIWSRRGNALTAQFPRIARACQRLQPETLIDGEIVALDDRGRPSFNLLQHHRSEASAIQFYAFDLLIYRRKSLLQLPLEIRRELLDDALKDPIAVGVLDGR